MPQWTPRLLSPHRASETQPGINLDMSLSSFLPTTHRRAPSQLSEADVLENASNIPVLHPRESLASYALDADGLQQPSRHGRSMSHPFPSIFQSKKKRDGSSGALVNEAAPVEGSCYTLSKSPSKAAQNTRSTKAVDRDLMTGKCMTCDSTVRWPKELKVFRCTVCLTINDLIPLSTSRRAKEQPGIFDAGNSNKCMQNPQLCLHSKCALAQST